MSSRGSYGLLIGVLVMVLAAPAYAELLGVAYVNQTSATAIYAIDEKTNTATPLAATGNVVHLNDVVRDRNGAFWSEGIDTSFVDHLVTIDPTTGATTEGAKLTWSGSSLAFRGMAFSLDDVLYGTDANDYLYTADVTTGIATRIGRIGTSGYPQGIESLRFDSNGILYGWGVDVYGTGLVTINPLTAAPTRVSASSPNTPSIQSLAFGPGGTLYGTSYSTGSPYYSYLWSIDKNTGVATQIGGTWTGGSSQFQGIRGIDYVSTPEPSTLALLGVGALGLLACAWRRRRSAGSSAEG